MSENENKKVVRRPKLKLPFTNEKSDMGAWAFDHRVGLCVIVIAYLVLAIAFVSTKVFVGPEQHTQGFYIDIEQLEQLEQLRDQLQEEVEQKQEFDWSSVSNRRSNENSLDERVVDDRGTDATALNDEAARAQEEMAENRKAYQEAINSINEERAKAESEQNNTSTEKRDIKRKGNVTVSYSFVDPVRHAQDLYVPAYQCQGGGEVEVEVVLARNGKVVSADIIDGGDDCMQQTALSAAKRSRFNKSEQAPQKHVGTITYIFIPQ